MRMCSHPGMSPNLLLLGFCGGFLTQTWPINFISSPSGRRQWHPTPVLLPGKSHGHGWRSLVGCSPWVSSSQTRLSHFTFTFHFHALEKERATQSSVLAWRIPGTGEPGGLQSMGSHRVGYDWSDLAAAASPSPLSAMSRSGAENYKLLIMAWSFWWSVPIQKLT